MPNSLYNALSGGVPSQVPQPSAPVPPGSPGLGAGSIFQALQGMQPQSNPGAQPLELGPMVADNTGLMKGNPFYREPESAQPSPKQSDKAPPKKESAPAKDPYQNMANILLGGKSK